MLAWLFSETPSWLAHSVLSRRNHNNANNTTSGRGLACFRSLSYHAHECQGRTWQLDSCSQLVGVRLPCRVDGWRVGPLSRMAELKCFVGQQPRWMDAGRTEKVRCRSCRISNQWMSCDSCQTRTRRRAIQSRQSQRLHEAWNLIRSKRCGLRCETPEMPKSCSVNVIVDGCDTEGKAQRAYRPKEGSPSSSFQEFRHVINLRRQELRCCPPGSYRSLLRHPACSLCTRPLLCYGNLCAATIQPRCGSLGNSPQCPSSVPCAGERRSLQSLSAYSLGLRLERHKRHPGKGGRA